MEKAQEKIPGGFPCLFSVKKSFWLIFHLLYPTMDIEEMGNLWYTIFRKSKMKGCETDENINQRKIWAAHDD